LEDFIDFVGVLLYPNLLTSPELRSKVIQAEVLEKLFLSLAEVLEKLFQSLASGDLL
jgi:hypothetical protein